MTVLDLAILPWTLRLQYNNINGLTRSRVKGYWGFYLTGKQGP